MENVRNRIKMHLTNDDDNAEKWFSKVNFKTASDVDGMYFIQMDYDEVKTNKPIYVGTSILDLSKVCMMDFHFNVIHKQFEGNYSLLYSDTDSLVYEFRNLDIYEWLNNNREHFDLTKLKNPKTIHLKDATNDTVLGKMKDENHGFTVKELLALSPKVYSIVHQHYESTTNEVIENYNTKKLKGVSKAVVKTEINHEDFKTTLETHKPIEKVVYRIASFNHNVYSYQNKKVALSAYYDKMYMIANINWYPHGYKK